MDKFPTLTTTRQISDLADFLMRKADISDHIEFRSADDGLYVVVFQTDGVCRTWLFQTDTYFEMDNKRVWKLTNG